MGRSLVVRARTGVAVMCAALLISAVSGGGAAWGKTTKKAKGVKKATPTTVRKAGGAKTPTTAGPAEQGGKSIVGQELAPGEPIKLGILGPPPSEGAGNVERMYEIALDSLRKQGKLPVYGRDIVPYYRAYNGASDAEQRGACTALGQDDRVFAVLTYATRASAHECVAAEYKIPAVGGSVTDEAMARAWPYVFTVFASTTRGLRNIAYWADSEGLLKGRKIGMYHGNAAGRQKQLDDHMKPSFKKLGYTIAEDLAGSVTAATGDPAGDRVAVQRLKAAGVNTVILMTAQPGEFGRAAQAQGYHPKFIIAGAEGSIVCDGCPARVGMTKEMFDGTPAMGGGRASENGYAGNPQPHPSGVECASRYEKLSGERVRQDGTLFEQQRWQSVQWSCLEYEILAAALKAAGPKLTQGGLINALETSIKGVQSGFFPDITFSRTNHFGSVSVRTVALDGDCICWKIKSPLREFFVE